ncbi:MAG: hypothetical protein RLZZ444_2162 [Pseudomonadota bacterium]
MQREDLEQAAFRYIKLGPGGQWARRAIQNDEIYLSHKEVPHQLALTGDRRALIEYIVEMGKTAGKAADYAREILDFYTQPATTIWVTFHDGSLWWARAEEHVEWIGESDEHGPRMRKTIGSWRNTDMKGDHLRQDQMSTMLTGVAAYQQTICGIKAVDYLRRKLLVEENPLVTSAMALQAKLVDVASDLITGLHWKDFETLVDLLMTRGGWHRISALGGTMKDADLLVEHPVTGETALVQVKSAASQSVLADYISRLDNNPAWSRLIFVCHSPRGVLDASDRSDVTIWAKNSLAEISVKNGLMDWLVERTG